MVPSLSEDTQVMMGSRLPLLGDEKSLNTRSLRSGRAVDMGDVPYLRF